MAVGPNLSKGANQQAAAAGKVVCLVPVVGGLEGSSDGDVDVGGLVGGQLSKLGAQLGEMEGSDLLVQVLREGRRGGESIREVHW